MVGEPASGALGRVRLAVGVGCVAFAAVLFVWHVPRAVRSLDATVRGYGYLGTAQARLLSTGGVQGLPRRLQVQALAKIPPRSDYAVLLPATEAEAALYGINPITYETAVPVLRYLLLPAWPVDPADARFVICFGCDTDPWDRRTTWLWKDNRGDAIGRVKGR